MNLQNSIYMKCFEKCCCHLFHQHLSSRTLSISALLNKILKLLRQVILDYELLWSRVVLIDSLHAESESARKNNYGLHESGKEDILIKLRKKNTFRIPVFKISCLAIVYKGPVINTFYKILESWYLRKNKFQAWSLPYQFNKGLTFMIFFFCHGNMCQHGRRTPCY